MRTKYTILSNFGWKWYTTFVLQIQFEEEQCLTPLLMYTMIFHEFEMYSSGACSFSSDLMHVCRLAAAAVARFLPRFDRIVTIVFLSSPSHSYHHHCILITTIPFLSSPSHSYRYYRHHRHHCHYRHYRHYRQHRHHRHHHIHIAKIM